MVDLLKSHKRFLVKLSDKHKFYQEVYVKGGGKSYYFMRSLSENAELILKEIILLGEVNIINKEEGETLINMILNTEDADNVLIGMLLLKKHRKELDKNLKDPVFAMDFINNIALDYYSKIHKPYMERVLSQIKNK